MKSLFGDEISDTIPKPILGKYKKFKAQNHYRKSERGNRCGVCKHCNRFEYHDKYYFKCALMGHSFSEASDIRASYICDKYV